MAKIEHVVRGPEGELVTLHLTPVKAIWVFCTECMGHQPARVQGCTSELCPLFPFRRAFRSWKPRAMSTEVRAAAVARLQEARATKKNACMARLESTIAPG